MNALIEDGCVRERFQGGCLTEKMEIEGGLTDKHRKLSAAAVFWEIPGLEHKFWGYLHKNQDKESHSKVHKNIHFDIIRKNFEINRHSK